MAEGLLGVARAAVRAHLSAHAAAHSERTAATARELARRFGVDEDAAELAGLLHDWSREDDPAALVSFADQSGMAVLDIERENPYLLHARVAAEQVREIFPEIPLEVESAVASHTLGGVPMAPLDQIVYVADSIEPARSYPGVDALRAAAAEGTLDEVFEAVFARTVAHVREKGKPLHPLSEHVAAAIEKRTGVRVPGMGGERP